MYEPILGISPEPIQPKAGFTLRLSVTDRCNFRCRYCMPSDSRMACATPNQLPLDSLADLAAWCVDNLGVRRIKITGGEPLVRKGLPRLVQRLSDMAALDEVTMTTNGFLLKRFANELALSGLKRVNISLDTLNPARFREICGGELDGVIAGVDEALNSNLKPVKLNCVLHRSWWREDVPALLEFAADRGIEIRFIELMPMGAAALWAREQFVAATTVINWLAIKTKIDYLPAHPGVPARHSKLLWKGKLVTVGWITPETETFCDGCDRLRLDARGNLRRCLMDSHSLPLYELVANAGSQTAHNEFFNYLRWKRPPVQMQSANRMTALGG